MSELDDLLMQYMILPFRFDPEMVRGISVESGMSNVAMSFLDIIHISSSANCSMCASSSWCIACHNF